VEDRRKALGASTRVNHPPEVELTEGNRPILAPIYHSAKFTMSAEKPYWDQFVYTRISNPSLRRLELLLAEMQKKEECLVVSSGIAALTGVFLGVLKSGDHLITFKELYKPARVFIQDYLPRFGIATSILSLKDLDQLDSYIQEGKTKLIHFETPTNPNLEIIDIEKLIKIAHNRGVLVSLDGTFAGLHQHTQFKTDLVMQSLTKYANGHGDVIAGSIAGSATLIKRIRDMSHYLGTTLDPQAANLIERGLKTYYLRYSRQSQSAFKIAEFLEKHPKIKWVRYPGLASHPSHRLAKKQQLEMGGIVSFELQHDLGMNAQDFCHRVGLIQLAASLGSTESLIAPSLTFFGSDLPPDEAQKLLMTPYSLRLSVGLEEPEDLISDLQQALF
jgi:cystathionine beta-lyase/cystathionine gamma-synthase